MVVDAVRTYLEAANGFTELTRKRAVAAAKTLLKESDERSGGAITRATDTAKSTMENVESSVRGTRVGHSIQALASDLIETSKTNRAAISNLVEGEVERFLDRLDLVRRDEHDRLVRRVAELERRLASATAAQRRRSATAEEEDTAPNASAATPPVAPAPEPAPVAPAAAGATPSPDVESQAPETAARDSAEGQPEDAPAVQPAAAARAAKAKSASRPRTAAKGQAKRTATRKGAGPAKDGGK